jgi:hypothetical protein
MAVSETLKPSLPFVQKSQDSPSSLALWAPGPARVRESPSYVVSEVSVVRESPRVPARVDVSTGTTAVSEVSAWVTESTDNTWGVR